VICIRNQATCVGASAPTVFSLKEVIQPQVPLGLPCYDFTPVMNHTVVTVLSISEETGLD